MIRGTVKVSHVKCDAVVVSRARCDDFKISLMVRHDLKVSIRHVMQKNICLLFTVLYSQNISSLILNDQQARSEGGFRGLKTPSRTKRFDFWMW